MTQQQLLSSSGAPIEWQYPIKYGEETEFSCDVLILGGGLSGCYAAIAAARKGLDVVIVEKGCVKHSGAAGVGVDHWMDCPSNPASSVSVEEYLKPLKKHKGGFANYINYYITAKESWDVLLELEEMGMKIRDTEDEFKGADFRDEETKLLFSYDYKGRHCIRVWGSKMKPVLHKECKRLGVKLVERTMVTSLLTEDGKQGGRVVGATGLNVRTGEFSIFKAKSSVLTMATPERVWIFSTEHAGLVGRDGPPTNAGNGFAMAFRAGAEFVRMEASTHEEWGGSTGIGSVMFGSGSNFATWYPCTIVDSEGKEVPWIGKDGKILKEVSERAIPKPDQDFFALIFSGGGEDENTAMPQLIPDLKERIKKGEYKLPLYANLPGMPEHERRVIFGLMVGQEGHTWVVYRNLTRAGFDPDKDMLQCYELAPAPLGWRRLRYGGLVHDWTLKSSLDGLYGAGQQLFEGMGVANACATGRWAGGHAAEYAKKIEEPVLNRDQIENEKKRVYQPTKQKSGIDWKELASGIAKTMQDYCGDTKTEELMKIGMLAIDEIKSGEATTLHARNPHELMRSLEVLDILTVCEMIIQTCNARKSTNNWINFERLDYPDNDPAEWRKWISLKLNDQKIELGEIPLDFCGDLEGNYNKHKIEHD